MLSVQPPPFLQKKSESGKGTVFFSLFLFCLFVCFYQLFRERLSEKVHATIPKGIVGGFEFPVDPKKLERMAGEAMDICLRVLMESNKSRFDSYSTVVRKSVLIISRSRLIGSCHIPYYFSGLSGARFPDNLSRNSCIPKPQILSNRGG